MKHFGRRAIKYILLFWGALSSCLYAETGAEGWLRYSALDEQAAKKYERLPASTVALNDSLVLKTAQQEMIRGVRGMLGKTPRTGTIPFTVPSILLGKFEQLHALAPELTIPSKVREDGYWLSHGQVHGFECVLVAASTERGVLYGVFAFLSKIARNEDILALDEVQQPSAPLRWINQWDNLDGRIERGYAGASIFFEGGNVRADLTRADA